VSITPTRRVWVSAVIFILSWSRWYGGGNKENWFQVRPWLQTSTEITLEEKTRTTNKVSLKLKNEIRYVLMVLVCAFSVHILVRLCSENSIYTCSHEALQQKFWRSQTWQSVNAALDSVSSSSSARSNWITLGCFFLRHLGQIYNTISVSATITRSEWDLEE